MSPSVRKENPVVRTNLISENYAYLNRSSRARGNRYYLTPAGSDCLRCGNILRGDRPSE